MLPLQLVLRPERNDCAWPSPPRIHARKSRSILTRRVSNRAPLVCSVQQSYLSPPTPKTFRRRSRHLAISQSSWATRDGLNAFIHYWSTVVKTVVSTTTAIAQSLYETASTTLQNWWNGKQEGDVISLEAVERESSTQDLNDILEENNRLKRMIKFAVSSHAIMNEATSILEDGADLCVKRAGDVVDIKVHEVQERDALTLQLEELQEQLEDKDQEIERLRDGYVWATENLNTKEDEICELHERLEHYETLLKSAKVV
ncbi:hypothetical protein PPTG_18964 [Phytophthora nicotianae INRA-310]|uniref:Uncharacterized protein n=2 Tax=Phytophthora nicotianae TaxID=4792 RepID=W2PDU2_PHYN3|nr:hypothetical protein PPTG_18964 [Phytophthora nicotianae INRA-310]ETM99232.1 hypothetical protein PPTG_18964 [Phytophthora nicotianae INRA-310]KUF98076.1 Phosphoenolpyruvate carboxykinase [Phytophthora nicotianae]